MVDRVGGIVAVPARRTNWTTVPLLPRLRLAVCYAQALVLFHAVVFHIILLHLTFVRPLDSGGSAIDNQVIAEYITTLIRSQKERCGSNFLGTAKSANGNDGLEPLTSSIRLLFRSKLTINDRRFNHARANEICTNLPVLQFCSPSANEGAQRRLGGGVGSVARIAFQPNTRPDKNH